jgi:hypothetical protein
VGAVIERRKARVIKNADGSVDTYFGPKAPDGQEANWIRLHALLRERAGT